MNPDKWVELKNEFDTEGNKRTQTMLDLDEAFISLIKLSRVYIIGH